MRAAPEQRGYTSTSAGRNTLGNNLLAYLLIAPAVLCFALFSWYPGIKVIILSFQHYNFGTATFDGLANYRAIFSDPEFVAAWRNTFEFTGIALVLGFGVPFITAVVINEMRHARWFFRTVVYLPVVIPPVVTALLWKWFYTPGSGLFDLVLRGAHLPTSSWIYSTNTAIVSLVLVTTWGNMGLTTLIYLTGLQNIPGQLYEAAELDGAGIWRRFRHVTVPQTRYLLLILMLLQIIATMQVFTEVYVMTGGGPQNATVTVLYLIYQYAFNYNNYGGACALSAMLLVFLAIFSAFYLRLTRSHG